MSREKGENTLSNNFNPQATHPYVVTQHFEYFNSSVVHENALQVSTTNGRSLEIVEIKNHFSTMVDNTLIKITEIQFHNKVVKIIDTFTCIPLSKSPQVLPSSQEKPVKKPQHYRKLLANNNTSLEVYNNGNVKSSTKKNVVKNIFRLFQTWADSHGPPELQLGQSLKNLFRNIGKYNNDLIISMSKEPTLREAFQLFSQTSGEQSIGKSRIQDKQSHLQALHRYTQIFFKEGKYDEFRLGEIKNSHKDDVKIEEDNQFSVFVEKNNQQQ